MKSSIKKDFTRTLSFALAVLVAFMCIDKALLETAFAKATQAIDEYNELDSVHASHMVE